MILLQISSSGPDRVVLRDIQSDMAGKYRCEVSTDVPDFHTEVVSAQMHVISMSNMSVSLVVNFMLIIILSIFASDNGGEFRLFFSVNY